MSNQNEELMKKMLGDPALLKMLEKMTRNNGIELAKAPKVKALKELGNPSHVNRVLSICKLCGTESISYMRMDHDIEDKLFRGGCYHLDNIWPHLPLYDLRQRRSSCKHCTEALAELPKETLINKLLVMAERINYNV